MNATISVRLALVLRLAAGALLALGTAHALLAPHLPLPARLAACVVMALTLWRPHAGLVAVAVLAPAGLILAPPPARAAELLVWAFLAAWLLAAWRPLTGMRSRDGAVLPVALYGLCAAASWAGYTIRRAPGITPHLLPLAVARELDAAHLVFSSPEPETWTLLAALAGLALFAAAAMIARGRPDVRRQVAAALVASSALVAAITVADVLRQWAALDYGAWFLLRYVHGERFSFHLHDLNAAGSQYVLGGLVAVAMAAGDAKRRALWIAALVPMLPALYLSGSRSAALGALLVGGALIPLMRGGAPPRIRPLHAAALLLVVAAAGIGCVVAASSAGEQGTGTASGSLRLRSQFLVTSARMFASAPVFGVGIGHYHERSNEFMPTALREVYRYENAHNYFAQQFAELGALGGVLFLWLVAAAVSRGWRAARGDRGAEPALVGLLAAVVGYLLTCVTGHPLLVPEAALPFWAAFGVVAAAAPDGAPARRLLIVGIVLLIAFGIVLEARRYALAATPPGERGFYGLEVAEDGTPFVWMTRRAFFHTGAQPGTLVIPVQAPDFLTRDEPFRVAVEVGGRRVGVYDVAPGRWTRIEIPIRHPAPTPFRRIDLRANQAWTPRQDRGLDDDGPRSVMVGETRWTPAGGR